ncbi:MAG: NADH-quinone oxidoreductase subunit C [Acidimicrobiia bacterium]|nr:NADH-quinone oxidoreductase subunit C [Acidimicrobiia bacterium]
MLHGALVSFSRGQRVAHPSREQLTDVVRALRDEGWLMCLDIAGVDYLAHDRSDLPAGIEPERFEVVVTLISHAERERLRLRVQVPESDPVVPSLFEVHPGTESMEREVFDLFGIGFDGHPDLTRILMPEDWHGHPLRKDYAVGAIPIQFKDAPSR